MDSITFESYGLPDIAKLNFICILDNIFVVNVQVQKTKQGNLLTKSVQNLECSLL